MTKSPLKRYLIFAGEVYHPQGGWHDFLCDTDSLEEAMLIRKRKNKGDSWSDVVDTHTLELVDPSPFNLKRDE